MLVGSLLALPAFLLAVTMGRASGRFWGNATARAAASRRAIFGACDEAARDPSWGLVTFGGWAGRPPHECRDRPPS